MFSDADIGLLKAHVNQVPQVRAISVFTDNELVYGFQMSYDNGLETKRHVGAHAHPGV